MVDVRIMAEWIAKAEEDYLFTEKQAAEKYLKAYIVARSMPLRKIHDLVELVKMCAQEDRSFEELKEDATLLNPYYVDTRYPAVWPMGFSKDDARTALAAAGRIREFIKAKLSR